MTAESHDDEEHTDRQLDPAELHLLNRYAPPVITSTSQEDGAFLRSERLHKAVIEDRMDPDFAAQLWQALRNQRCVWRWN